MNATIATEHKTYAERWTGCDCTLNGKPARVRGRLCRYAKVGETFGGPEYDWAWPVVDRVMRRDGAFRVYGELVALVIKKG